MVQREIADRLRAGAGQPHLRLAQRRSPSSPARCELLRTVDPAVFQPRPRVDSAILRLRRTGPGADAGDARAGPRRLRPPPQVAGPLARARRGRARSRAARAALAELGLPEDARAEALSPDDFAALSAKLRPTLSRAPMLIHAPAKLNLCLYLGPRREDGLHELCSLFEPLALADLIEVARGRARRGRLPRGRGREPGGAGAGGAARARLGARRRCGSRSRSGSRSPPGSAAAAPTPPRSCGWRAGEVADLRADRGRARRRRALASSRPALALVARRGRAGRARCPTPAAARGRAAARRRRAQHRRGLRRGRPARASAATRRSSTSWPRGCARRPAPAPRRSPIPSCSSTTSSRRRARCGPTIGDALDALREAGAPVALLTGSGPTAVRALRRPRRGPAPRPSDRPRRRDRLRGGERRREAARRGGRRQPQTAR